MRTIRNVKITEKGFFSSISSNPFIPLISFILAISLFLSAIPKTMTVSGDAAGNKRAAYRCGDVNGDGYIKIDDALEILMYLANVNSIVVAAPSSVVPSYNVNAWRAAAISKLGSPYVKDINILETPITISDALQILMYLANMTTSALNICVDLDGCSWCTIEEEEACFKCGKTDCDGGCTCEICDKVDCDGSCIFGDILPNAVGVTENFRNLTAKQLTSEIRVGWNLGNTFDACDKNSPAGHGLNTSLRDLEAKWIGKTNVTTKTLFPAIKQHGFNAVRIPVTWFKVADPNNNYKIREDFMNRIKEVVCWALAEDMIVILNTHHEEKVVKLHDKDMELSEQIIASFWEQIAETFKEKCDGCGKDCEGSEFNERLIFEGLNEPRDVTRADSFDGGTEEERINLNKLGQVFVDKVRASGGNNAYRVLMLPTYAASPLSIALNSFTVPKDADFNTTDGVSHKIILSVHSYTPSGFCFGGRGTLDSLDTENERDMLELSKILERVGKKADNLGIPAIMGEWASSNKENVSERAEHARYYVKNASLRGIKCFWWDDTATSSIVPSHKGSFGLISRVKPHNPLLTFGPIVEAIMDGAGDKPPKVPAPKGE